MHDHSSIQTFARFKYAEEHARDLDLQGKPWVMFRAPDESHEEDGEIYENPVYVVSEILNP